MAGPLSLILGLFALLALAVLIVIAAILIGIFFTGLIGGIILLFTGKHFSKDTKKKVACRVCIVVGIVLLALAGGSAGIFIKYAIEIFG